MSSAQLLAAARASLHCANSRVYNLGKGDVYILEEANGNLTTFFSIRIQQCVYYAGDVYEDEEGNEYQEGYFVRSSIEEIRSHPQKYFTGLLFTDFVEVSSEDLVRVLYCS